MVFVVENKFGNNEKMKIVDKQNLSDSSYEKCTKTLISLLLLKLLVN